MAQEDHGVARGNMHCAIKYAQLHLLTPVYPPARRQNTLITLKMALAAISRKITKQKNG